MYIGSSGSKIDKSEKGTRRSWSLEEEESLIEYLKELVADNWKSDNSFKAGYLKRLEVALKKKFPEAGIKGYPHINSRIQTWKRQYYTLVDLLKLSGIGFNHETNMIDCDRDVWENKVKVKLEIYLSYKVTYHIKLLIFTC